MDSFAAWVSAIATVVYTAGTFMLWYVTRKSLQNSERQLKLYEEQLLQQNKLTEFKLIDHIYSSFRELYTDVLRDEVTLLALADQRHMSSYDVKKSYLASFIINHSFELFTMNEKGLVPKDMWQRMVPDIHTVYTWEIIQNRWKHINHLYPETFQSFVQNRLDELK